MYKLVKIQTTFVVVQDIGNTYIKIIHCLTRVLKDQTSTNIIRIVTYTTVLL